MIVRYTECTDRASIDSWASFVQRPLWQLVGSADRGSDKLLIDAVPLHEQGVATRFHDASAIHYVNHEVATI